MKKIYKDVLPNADIVRKPCVEMCDGCDMIFSGTVDICKAYIDPSIFVVRGCALKTNKAIFVDAAAKSKLKRKFRRAKI